jgi:hypothetical protein
VVKGERMDEALVSGVFRDWWKGKKICLNPKEMVEERQAK